MLLSNLKEPFRGPMLMELGAASHVIFRGKVAEQVQRVVAVVPEDPPEAGPMAGKGLLPYPSSIIMSHNMHPCI